MTQGHGKSGLVYGQPDCGVGSVSRQGLRLVYYVIHHAIYFTINGMCRLMALSAGSGFTTSAANSYDLMLARLLGHGAACMHPCFDVSWSARGGCCIHLVALTLEAQEQCTIAAKKGTARLATIWGCLPVQTLTCLLATALNPKGQLAWAIIVSFLG